MKTESSNEKKKGKLLKIKIFELLNKTFESEIIKKKNFGVEDFDKPQVVFHFAECSFWLTTPKIFISKSVSVQELMTTEMKIDGQPRSKSLFDSSVKGNVKAGGVIKLIRCLWI